MLNRLVELHGPVCVLSDRNIVKPANTRMLEHKDKHWQMMTDLLPVLRSLQIATSVTSAKHMPTSSLLMPMLIGLVDDHLKADADDSMTVSTFKCHVEMPQCNALHFKMAMATTMHVIAAVRLLWASWS